MSREIVCLMLLIVFMMDALFVVCSVSSYNRLAIRFLDPKPIRFHHSPKRIREGGWGMPAATLRLFLAVPINQGVVKTLHRERGPDLLSLLSPLNFCKTIN